MIREIAATVTFIAALGIAGSASATIIDVTYAGTIGTGIDISGVFGAAGSSLTGDSYTATYKFDDSKGLRTTLPPYLDDVIGGPFNGDSDPSLGATLTINGKTVSFNGGNLGLEENFPLGGSISSYAANLAPAGAFDAGFIGNSLAASGIPASLDTPFSTKGTLGTNGFVNAFQIANGPGRYEVASASGTLDPDRVTVTVGSAVPEAPTWMLLVAGAGITGAMLRRRLRRRSKDSVYVREPLIARRIGRESPYAAL